MFSCLLDLKILLVLCSVILFPFLGKLPLKLLHLSCLFSKLPLNRLNGQLQLLFLKILLGSQVVEFSVSLSQVTGECLVFLHQERGLSFLELAVVLQMDESLRKLSLLRSIVLERILKSFH